MPLLPPPRKSQPKASIDVGAASVWECKRQPETHAAEGRWWDHLLRQSVFRWLAPIRDGRIEILDCGKSYWLGSGDPSSLTATVKVHDPRFYRHLVLGGELGAAKAFIRGYWDSGDLVNLVRIFCRNGDVSRSGKRGLSRLAQPFRRIAHLLRRNSVAGSLRNIASHYDLSNEFFAHFLDETMTYSCGIFEHPDSSLEEAALAKYDRICRKLQLCSQDHLLEIGCGWGAFAVYAARHYGCRVTATTISRQQLELAHHRVREAGLEGRVVVLGEDYRSLRGVYDKLVSVEMIEAVGERYFDTYFRICNNLIKTDGMMLLQAITIADQNYESYRRSVDFIQRYVFPGGFLPSVEAICRSLTRSTDFRLFHLEDITPHYAHTLELWRQRFHTNLPEIRGLGLPEDLLRIWEFYFCYCEGGFRERVIGAAQVLLTRSQCRRAPIAPRL